MNVIRTLLMRAFGRPQGFLGRLGGAVMARTNARFGIWVSDRLGVRPNEEVLEIGFGPGVVMSHVAAQLATGHASGIDASREMVGQARARNRAAIARGRVALRQGSVENLPFCNNHFDKAFAVNSMQVWPDAAAGLREICRVLKPGGIVALGFTPHAGQSESGLHALMAEAGFLASRLVQGEGGFCLLAKKPGMIIPAHPAAHVRLASLYP
jgi:SAM-dependent methyltransferase